MKNTITTGERDCGRKDKLYIFPAFGERAPHFQFVPGHANYVAHCDNIRSLCNVESSKLEEHIMY